MHFRSIKMAVVAATWLPAIAAGAAAVMLTVTDGGARQSIACRVHLKDEGGQPVKVDRFPFFRGHFVCPGTAALELKAGRYSYEIERGPEYRLARGEFSCRNGILTSVRETLERVADLAREGWWSGDLHVHRATNDIELLMRAEDLHVAPVMTWWNKQNAWAGRTPPRNHLARFDGNRFYDVMAGEDEREGGALLYFHLDAPLNIADAAREYPASAKFLAEARKAGGARASPPAAPPHAAGVAAGEDAPAPKEARSPAWVDIEKPFWYDVPVWLAHGVDSVGLACNHMLRDGMYESEAWGRARDVKRLPPPRGNGFYTQEIYYHILNAGLRLPPSAGSASGVLPNPVGYNRVYVHVEGALTWKKWWEGLRAGRCFVSNGPLLRARANGEWPGHVFTGRREVKVALKADFTTREPIAAFEIVLNGHVERIVPFAEWERTRSLGQLNFTESGWFLVRAITDNPKTFRFASTAPWYVEVGGAPQRVSRVSAQFFLDWCRERMERIRLADDGQREEVLQWHRAAERFWERRVREANAE